MALKKQPSTARAEATLTYMCELYEQQKQDNTVDVYTLVELSMQSEDEESEDREIFYQKIFNQLSPGGQQMIIDMIKEVRGTQSIGYGRTDLVALSRDIPEVVAERFKSSCKRWPSILAKRKARRASGQDTPVTQEVEGPRP